MKVVAVVPVKLNNQRMPGKNIKKFDDGTALITFFLKSLVKVNGIDEIYVFCSDVQIKDYLISGVRYLQRPFFLDTQQATPQNIIEEFMKRVDADIYMVSHCTSPFVSIGHIEQCIEAVKEGKGDSAFTAVKIQRLLWKESCTPLNFAADNIPRTQDLEPIYSEVSAAYVFEKNVFLKSRRRVGQNPYIVEVSGIECIDIDYPEDFEIANAIYMKMIRLIREVNK